MNKDELEKELIKLNNEVKEVVEKRSKFLDDNMKYFAEFQIGDKVFNCKTGRIGICSKHYRLNEDRPELDTSLRCDCEIKESRYYDNTSRFIGFNPWVKYEDYENKTDTYIRKLEIISRGF
jgi:hypothetical protein